MTRLLHGNRARAGILSELGTAPKIALLRAGGLGDFISTTAALKALRSALPRAGITLITEPHLADFARRYPEIDEIVVPPAYPGVIRGEASEAALSEFFGAMRRKRFDLVMQWHGGGTHSNEFIARLGARVTAGFRGDDARELDYWLPYDIRQHEVLRYLDLLRLLGIDKGDTAMYVPLLRSDFEELASLGEILDLDLLARGRCIGIHATAGRPSRRWAPWRFAAVADRLLEEFDLDAILVTAGPGQESDSAAVVENMAARDRAVDLGGRTSLGAMLAMLSRLRMLLTNDSGPAHMAVALDVPSVVVFGSAHPVNWAPLERTWHRVVANWAAPCRWMLHDGCPDTPDVECLMGVHHDEVLAESRRLLQLLDRVDGARANSTRRGSDSRPDVARPRRPSRTRRNRATTDISAQQ